MAKVMVEKMELDRIVPYENNPRRNERAISAVENSIKQFGYQNPIIVDKNNIVIAGHSRLEAAKRLGIKVLPVIVADDLTSEQANAFRLADNRTASFSEWDERKLRDELADVVEIDMSDFGFKMELVKEIASRRENGKVHVCPRCGHIW